MDKTRTVKKDAYESNSKCYFGCLACLAVAWMFVKLIICCSCRSLERLAHRRPATSMPQRSGEDLVVAIADCETDSGTPLHPGQKRVQFRDVVELFVISLPSARRMKWPTRPPVVERVIEEIKR